MAAGKQHRYAGPALSRVRVPVTTTTARTCGEGAAGYDRPRRRRTGDRHAGDRVRPRPADRAEPTRQPASALAARVYADLAAAYRADVPPRPPAARPACARPARSARRPLTRQPPGRRTAWSSRPPPRGSSSFLVSANSHYHAASQAPIAPYESSAPCPLFLAFAGRSARQSASWGVRSRLAGAAACRGRLRPGRRPRPEASGPAAAPAMARFPPTPAPTRPRPTCGWRITTAPTACPSPAGRASRGIRPAPGTDLKREASVRTGRRPSCRAGPYVFARQISTRPGAEQATRDARNPCSASLNPMALKCAPS